MITLSVDKELDATIYTVTGDIVYTEIRDAINDYYRGILTKYTIGDYSKTNPDKHLTSEEIQQLGIQITALGKARPDGFDLLIMPGLLQYGLARMYYGYAEMVSAHKINTKIFRSMEEAVAFIRRNEKPVIK